MGGAVSSGESNDDLIDNLLDSDYIKSPLVEQVFRGVDRAFYYTNQFKQNAYKDLAWKDGNLHLSAPCIYSEVMENIQIEEGMSFLNVGSGTGYLSTMVGLILGRRGVNHGIELYEDVVEYARLKLDEFLRTSSAVDMFDFCEPEFVVGNCLEIASCPKRYDRIYCGAACPESSVQTIIDLLKIGGVCIVPINDSLVHITRISDSRIDMKTLLPVSFASLMVPKQMLKPVTLPELNPMTLGDICRSEIRSLLRKSISQPEARNQSEAGRRRRRRKRQERRRASRLLVVQRRRSGGEPDGDQNGFVAIAYSMGRNSRNRNRRHSNEERASDGDEEDSAARRDSDHVMVFSSDDDEDVDFSDMPPLNDVEVQNDISNDEVNGLPSASSELGHESNHTKSSGQEAANALDSASPVATSSSSRGNSEIPPDSLPKIRPAASQPGSGGNERNSVDLINIYRARQNNHRSTWRRQCSKMFRMSNGLEESGSTGVLGSLRRPASDGRGNDEEMEHPSSSSDEDYDLDIGGYDSDHTVARTTVDDGGTTGNPTGDVSNNGSMPRCEEYSSESDEDQNNEDENITGKVSKMPNIYSIKMREKIQALPLPPKIKVYLNYNRNFV